ncbi:cell wall hydrolase SleB [Alicyclobacillus hesperidum subsp. aegles]|uniref:LysM peptidoglycan-binding domain-containing protein n=1 Tax=Alicyclobacillus hesperidum TaxID=89784 RepID=UPI00071916B4|nr:LysM peptidoglycan-binding domain-containing protein [Alicyclobacillus hesperidum]KRW90994.1 cell wall hydrolase [Alicyclobacillus tengchongensis]GLG00548.1 cell wall hydrolase SleB [Alicyclobacillus hesperidum subsp. aegles]
MRKKHWLLAAATMCLTSGFGVSTAMAATVKVAPGQSLWSIAHRAGISVQSIEAANPGMDPMNLQVGATVQVPSPTAYVVKPGDTLFTVGRRYGVTLSAMLAANPQVNPQNLQIGSTIRVPITSAQTTPTTNGTRQANQAVNAHVAAPTSDTTSNLYWLEHVINAEAGGESLQAQIAVGDVIMHRIAAGGYGNTVQQVVFQVSNGHYQFTSVANGYIYTAPNSSSITAAEDVLQKGQDLVPGALVFYNPAETPAGSWVRQQPVIRQIGNLVFAK